MVPGGNHIEGTGEPACGHGVIVELLHSSRKYRVHSFALSESTEGLNMTTHSGLYAAARHIPSEARKRIKRLTQRFKRQSRRGYALNV